MLSALLGFNMLRRCGGTPIGLANMYEVVFILFHKKENGKSVRNSTTQKSCAPITVRLHRFYMPPNPYALEMEDSLLFEVIPK